jgi:hypothetical protein
MVDLEALARRARRAAEWGRLRSASRVGLAVVPLALLAALVSRAPAVTAGVGLALLGATVALGWRSAEGARAARAGLALGAIPMAAGLFTIAVEGWCDPHRAVTVCGLGCLLAGVVAGGASAWYAARTRSPRRLRAWSAIGLVASLTAALGCMGLGAGSALAVLAALAAGAGAAWVPARTRSI